MAYLRFHRVDGQWLRLDGKPPIGLINGDLEPPDERRRQTATGGSRFNTCEEGLPPSRDDAIAIACTRNRDLRWSLACLTKRLGPIAWPDEARNHGIDNAAWPFEQSRQALGRHLSGHNRVEVLAREIDRR